MGQIAEIGETKFIMQMQFHINLLFEKIFKAQTEFVMVFGWGLVSFKDILEKNNCHFNRPLKEKINIKLT